MARPRLLVVQIAALGYDFLERTAGTRWSGLQFQPADSVFPALTCSVQGTVRTGLPPARHGMVFNGVFLPKLRRPSFWEQSSALVEGRRVWEGFRSNGGTVGMLFWQQSLGEDVDVLLSPWPVHKHGGALVDTTHSVPASLYASLRGTLGRPFRLRDYWGPLSNRRSSGWIAEATAEILQRPNAPDVLFSYLPHLDYALQKHGPDDERSARSLHQLLSLLDRLVKAAARSGYEVILYGDYAIGRAERALFPNRVLREAGWLATRTVAGRSYPNLHESRAFAVADHEIAHVYLRRPHDAGELAEMLRHRLGEAVDIQTSAEFAGGSPSTPAIGTLILAGRPGTWFAYPWWSDGQRPPDYARHIDIHNKPGFDPCELFFGQTPFTISTDPGRVGGTHGATGPTRRVAWASTLSIEPAPTSLLDLAKNLRHILASTD